MDEIPSINANSQSSVVVNPEAGTPINPTPQFSSSNPLAPKNNSKNTIVGLSVVVLILLGVVGGLFYKLQSAQKEYEGKMASLKTESAQILQNAKDESNKEILAIKEELAQMKKKEESNEILRELDGEIIDIDIDNMEKNIGKDEQRIAHLNTIATAIGAYYSDKEMFPSNDPSGCIPTKELNTNYFPKGVPKDPVIGHMNEGCSNPEEYVYRGYSEVEYERGNATTVKGTKFYAIGTKLDDPSLGNSAKPLSEYSEEETDSNKLYGLLIKGSGPYYILTN